MKKAIKYIISATIAAVLLWFSFRDVEWHEFMEGVRSCRWEFILLSMAAGAFAFWLRGLRWRQLLLPIDSKTTRLTTFNGINIGNISNFVFPRIGEFVRCGVIARRTTATYDKVLGTVVLERSWELLVMLLMLAIVIIGGFERFGTFFLEQIWQPMASRLNFSLWWVVVALAAAGSALIYIIKGQMPMARAVMRAYRDFLDWHGELAAKRRAVRSGAKTESRMIYRGSMVIRYALGRKHFEDMM